MAEKYGEVPPRFTKKWWEHFWYYYKTRVLLIALAVVIAAVTIVQCATRPKYDLTIVYAGHDYFSETVAEKLRTDLAEYITDIDNNGEKSLAFQQMTFSDSAGNEELDSAMQAKLDFTFTDDSKFLYLMDQWEAALYINRESADRIFEKAEAWTDGSNAEVLLAEDGSGYAVSLKNSRLMKQYRPDNADNVYLLIRKNKKTDDANIQAYNDSLNIARALLQE